MGISHHSLKFLQLARKQGELGEVLTFGRQNLNIDKGEIARAFGKNVCLSDYVYADALLENCLGAESVSSVDYSSYEEATYVRDLNRRFDLKKKFDLVLDSGTLEHVFDVAAGFRNAINHCKVGGRIIHALPSNSDCGHGFYQLSPELMLSLYGEHNGFMNTVVYVVKVMDEGHWWRVLPANRGERIMANSLSTTYIFCMTEKIAEVAELRVLQSDYEHAWEVGHAPVGEKSKSLTGQARALLQGTAFADVATLFYRTWLARTGVNRFNPHLRKISIASLI